jgi:phosphoribosyl-dephospho-CoA transferase
MVRLDPAAWPDVIATLPPELAGPIVADWAARGWPLVGRRPARGDLPGLVPLGLPLPPALGRHRLMLRTRPEAVRTVRRPPRLSVCYAAAPHGWRDTVGALVALDSETRCYGSLAWEMMTGLGYLTPASDLDLLWTAESPAAADALVDRIARLAESAPMRIDGELLFGSGRAVQWREWLSGTAQVIAKQADGVAMMPRDAMAP